MLPRCDGLWVAVNRGIEPLFYTGDRLPKWKGDVFVGGMRYGEIPGTGQLHRILINKNLEELRGGSRCWWICVGGFAT